MSRVSDLTYELTQIPGPSGKEERVANRLKELLQDHVDEMYVDGIGNLIARKKGTEGKHSLALVAHTDEVSFAVLEVDEYVWFDKISHTNLDNLFGARVLILARDRDVPGVVNSPSAHFEADAQKMWIDVGDRQKYIRPGDPIVVYSPPLWLNDEKTILASHSIDDRVGCAVMVETARRLTERPRHDIYFVGAAQEEIGLHGSRHFLRQIVPDWFIALDTGFAQDAVSNKTVPMRTGVGVRRLSYSGPPGAPAMVNFASERLNDLLIDTAKKLNITFHMDACTHVLSDHNTASNEHPEIQSTYLFVARRYTHSVTEVADMANAEHAVSILVEAIKKMNDWSS